MAAAAARKPVIPLRMNRKSRTRLGAGATASFPALLAACLGRAKVIE